MTIYCGRPVVVARCLRARRGVPRAVRACSIRAAAGESPQAVLVQGGVYVRHITRAFYPKRPVI